jgi:hypothetical protein
MVRGIMVDAKTPTLTWPAASFSHPMGDEHPLGAGGALPRKLRKVPPAL